MVPKKKKRREKKKNGKAYVERRHNGSPQTWEQPGLAALAQQAKSDGA